ncbi:hypothetical protein [Saccharothrix violaceirubra]|uniref:Uncharacterized protein n=1 Tax=Saccharothrix violaceirubra TaxID=413306 RepID=A0A7W7T934_9PSEU|nr:hypothetical protein [Saccharothrix violaceirubra]MBB4968606.1 hypothetical protein [Saccharothrix violaceirubra]
MPVMSMANGLSLNLDRPAWVAAFAEPQLLTGQARVHHPRSPARGT